MLPIVFFADEAQATIPMTANINDISRIRIMDSLTLSCAGYALVVALTAVRPEEWGVAKNRPRAWSMVFAALAMVMLNVG
jgi:hypothetical protein